MELDDVILGLFLASTTVPMFCPAILYSTLVKKKPLLLLSQAETDWLRFVYVKYTYVAICSCMFVYFCSDEGSSSGLLKIGLALINSLFFTQLKTRC